MPLKEKSKKTSKRVNKENLTQRLFIGSKNKQAKVVLQRRLQCKVCVYQNYLPSLKRGRLRMKDLKKKTLCPLKNLLLSNQQKKNLR